VNEANRCRDDKAARELIKGAKGLLLGNRENLPDRRSKVKLKVLKRIAYGYRDEAYFFLKIRAAFPGLQ